MATLTDAALADRILNGDPDALAALYDRYADRIHTMCVHLLRDRDEAADVTAEVFLTAVERIGQLRDPDKLRPWLYAIARNEVFRRTRQRTRVTPMADVGAASVDLGPDEGAELDPGAGPEELSALLQDAAAGLDERDRTVLELHLAQGLDGQDLADAVGVTTDHGYQLVHRMKERLERSMGALLVARAGRDLCDGLDEVADRWDGTYSVLWRKRFARHVDRCDCCSRMKSKLPRAVLAGAALATGAQTAVLAAPVSARERFLSEAPARVGHPGRRPWRGDGFPPARGARRRWPLALGLVLLLLFGLAVATSDGDQQVETSAPVMEVSREVAEDHPYGALLPPPTTTVPVTTTTTTLPATTTTADQPARTTTTIRRTPVAPPPPPDTAPTTTTAPPDTTAPTVSLSGPGCAAWGSSASYTASVSDAGGMGSVTLSWSGSSSGSGSMSGGGSSWTRSISLGSPMTSISVRATATDAAGNSRTSNTVTTTSGPTCT